MSIANSKIEHPLSLQVLFPQQCPMDPDRWVEAFRSYNPSMWTVRCEIDRRSIARASCLGWLDGKSMSCAVLALTFLYRRRLSRLALRLPTIPKNSNSVLARTRRTPFFTTRATSRRLWSSMRSIVENSAVVIPPTLWKSDGSGKLAVPLCGTAIAELGRGESVII